FEEGKKPKYNEKQSLEIAKNYIEKVNPDKLKNVELRIRPEMEKISSQNSYYFEFIRKIDDAYVEEDGISVRVDAINGEIVEYNLSWYNGDFPSKNDIISIDKAYDILFKDIGMELKYVTPMRYDDRNNKKEAILVYGLKEDKPA